MDSRVNIGQRQHRSLSLLELFIHNGGAKHAHALITHKNTDISAVVPWHCGMLTYITLIAQLMYPFKQYNLLLNINY